MLKRQAFLDRKVEVLGVVLDKVPRADHAILTSQLRRKFSEAGLLFAGGIPQDPVLERVRWEHPHGPPPTPLPPASRRLQAAQARSWR
jgi:hypothetical protein